MSLRLHVLDLKDAGWDSKRRRVLCFMLASLASVFILAGCRTIIPPVQAIDSQKKALGYIKECFPESTETCLVWSTKENMTAERSDCNYRTGMITTTYRYSLIRHTIAYSQIEQINNRYGIFSVTCYALLMGIMSPVAMKQIEVVGNGERLRVGVANEKFYDPDCYLYFPYYIFYPLYPEKHNRLVESLWFMKRQKIKD